ncbi:MAG: hypothetical protein AAF705_04385 [Bacteroidota bacterium]
MGILNDMKKLLFGAKSVAKSATNKVVESGKEAGEELLDKSEKIIKGAKDKAGDIGGDIKERAEDFFDIAKDKAEDALDKAVEVGGQIRSKAEEYTQKAVDGAEALFEKATGETEDIADELVPEQPPKPETQALDFSSMETAEDAADIVPDEEETAPETPREPSAIEQLGDRVLDAGAKAGNKLLDKSGELLEKLSDAGEKIGEQVAEKGGGLWEQAKSKTNELVEKAQEAAAKEKAEKESSMESMLDKAREMGEKIEARSREKGRDFMDSLEDAKKSTLEGTDSFFEKAKRFADGDYGNEGDIKITKGEPKQIENTGKTHGFEDLDGDGDDVIDDAIIEE